MMRNTLLLGWIVALGFLPNGLQVESAEPPPTGSIRPTALTPLPLGRIKPAGWLKRQLEVQAAGLSGVLDEFWPDIQSSAWIGGKAEGWERVPYWLDGLVPLAYLNDDPALKAKVKRYVDYILDHQRPDGWLGPIGDEAGHQPYDPWPLFPLFKALIQYEEATSDPRVTPALLRCARKIGAVVDETPLSSWGKMRAADFATALFTLHDRTGEPWLIDLARKAVAQGYDWRAHFDDFKFTGKTQGKVDLDSHGVNNAMGLKFGAVRYRLTGDAGDRGSIVSMLEKLDAHHGQANGMFTCDEHLAGRSPSQGTELCTVVEAMYSLETAVAITGDARLGDRLEKLAYNALPATFKKDMTAHQYDQQCNQVVCKREGEHPYVSNGPDSNLYGLEPNFGCCTANFHQGWPKFASSLWMKTPAGGLAVVSYAPCVVDAEVQGKPVKIEVRTDYPFRDVVEIVVTVPEPLTFPLDLRTPGWSGPLSIAAPNASIQAEAEGEAGWRRVEAEWKGTTVVRFDLHAEPRLYRGDEGAVAVERGPLVFALPIGADWKKLKDNPRFADWEVFPTSPWNFALEIDPVNPGAALTVEEAPLNAIGPPFSLPAPISIRAKGRRLANWGMEKGAAAPPPRSPAESVAPMEELRLVPYGCTDLRITEFPTLARSAGR